MTRYAILSDIHANDIALEAVLAHIDKQKPAVDEIYCLGDLVVYGVHPVETLSRLERLGLFNGHCVSGNNDFAIGHNYSADSTVSRMLADPEIAALGKDDPINRRRRGAIMMVHNWTHFHLKDTDFLKTLKKLPTDKTVPGEQIKLLHASPCDPIGMEGDYLRNTSQAEEAFMRQKEPICFFGHTHIPTIFQQTDTSRNYANVEHIRPKDGDQIELDFSDGKKVLVNPGSVGQPRDHDSRSSYLIYDTNGVVEFHRVEYEIRKIQDAILNLKDDLKANIMDIKIPGTAKMDPITNEEIPSTARYDRFRDIDDVIVSILEDRFQSADW